MKSTQSDKEFLADANKRLKKNYASIDAYLTDEGKRKPDSPVYKRRNAALSNWRGQSKRRTFTESQDWLPYITERYGWLVNIYNTNPEVADIIKNAYINDWSDEKYKSTIENSKWYLGLQAGEYDYLKGTFQQDRAYLDKIAQGVTTVKAVAGQAGYSLSDNDANILSAGLLKAGWSNEQLRQEIGKRVIASATQQPATPQTPEAQPTSLQTGTDAATIRSLAKSYGLKLTDNVVEGYVQSILNGSLTTEQVTSQMREQAKQLYPAVAKQLDAGTLDSATSSYRSIAAQTLGIDDSAIDFSDASKFGKLLTYKDPTSNEARLMNATEWTQYLRGLPEWQNTGEAKRAYSSAIETVERLFGKVR